MSDEKPKPPAIDMKDVAVFVPLFGSSIALCWEVGAFLPIGGFLLFPLSDHFLAAINCLPFAIVFSLFFAFIALFIRQLDSPPPMKFNKLMTSLLGLGSSAVLLLFANNFFALPNHSRHLHLFALALGFSAFLSVFFFVWFDIAVRSPAGLFITVLMFLLATLGASADVTFERMTSSRGFAMVTTKDGSEGGTIIMLGSSGVLQYRLDEDRVHFERMEEVKSIEWMRAGRALR